jgi:hypothetical protein
MIGYHLLTALDSEPKKWCFGHGGYLYARPSGQAALRSPNDYLTFAQACEPLPDEQKELFLYSAFQSVLYLRRGPMTPGSNNDDDMVWKLHKSDGTFSKGKESEEKRRAKGGKEKRREAKRAVPFNYDVLLPVVHTIPCAIQLFCEGQE